MPTYSRDSEIFNFVCQSVQLHCSHLKETVSREIFLSPLKINPHCLLIPVCKLLYSVYCITVLQFVAFPQNKMIYSAQCDTAWIQTPCSIILALHIDGLCAVSHFGESNYTQYRTCWGNTSHCIRLTGVRLRSISHFAYSQDIAMHHTLQKTETDFALYHTWRSQTSHCIIINSNTSRRN